MRSGKVVQVIGPVVDLEFPQDQLPDIYNAIVIRSEDQEDKTTNVNLTLEVAQHLGNNLVRCVAMSSTDGLVRGMKAIDQGQPITVPVGEKTLGRIFNVIGEPIDEIGPVEATERWPITACSWLWSDLY